LAMINVVSAPLLPVRLPGSIAGMITDVDQTADHTMARAHMWFSIP
jgi:hypothetical protein